MPPIWSLPVGSMRRWRLSTRDLSRGGGAPGWRGGGGGGPRPPPPPPTPALPGFGSRVLFVALLAGFVALQSRLLDWSWWRFPLDYSLVAALDLVVGWTLAGLVLAWRVKPAAR